MTKLDQTIAAMDVCITYLLQEYHGLKDGEDFIINIDRDVTGIEICISYLEGTE